MVGDVATVIVLLLPIAAVLAGIIIGFFRLAAGAHGRYAMRPRQAATRGRHNPRPRK